MKLRMVDIICDEESQGREFVDPTDSNIVALANDIKENGLNNPIVVKKVNDHYEVLAGFKRFVAHQILNAETIEVTVK